MIRPFALLICLVPGIALAQQAPQMDMPNGMSPQMMQHNMQGPMVPTQPGQDAFGAIQEIVSILEADPQTDWSKVNIEALRQHLIDMNNVTLSAVVTDEPVTGGMRYIVSGTGAVKASIQRMVAAHAATMNGVDGWHFAAAMTESGATLTVIPPAQDLVKLHGLGFIGVLAKGMHHQQHHLMLARGENPHG